MSPPYVRSGKDASPSTNFSIIKIPLNTETDPKNISKNLHLQPGEIRMVLELEFFTNKPDEAAKRFGCFIVKPQPMTNRSFFNKLIIFSPRPGLFSETPPQ